MLSSPFFSQEDNFDMKSGGERTFSGNNAHSDSNSSIMLRTAAKPEATEVEIPDWTDGKVREMMDDYERECAAGRLTGAKATERKQLMLKEIEEHQGQLIEELEKIHGEQGERQDTATLLTLWKKKMETWQNEVNSLGDDCAKEVQIEEFVTDFESNYQIYTDLCDKGVLPARLKNELMKLMEEAIEDQKKEKLRLEQDLEDYKKLYGSSDKAKVQILKYEEAISNLNAVIIDQNYRLDDLKKRNCNPLVNVNVLFEGNSNDMITVPDLSSQKFPAFLTALQTHTNNNLHQNDSILVLPLSQKQYIEATKIGQNKALELFLKEELFFIV